MRQTREEVKRGITEEFEAKGEEVDWNGPTVSRRQAPALTITYFETRIGIIRLIA